MMKSNPAEALEYFETVVLLEEARGTMDFSFNATKYIVGLAMQLEQFPKMLSSTRQLLLLSGKVSKNDLTEAVNTIQDQIQTRLAEHPDAAKEMYQLILGNLKQSNERLWFATCLRLGKIYFDERNYELLETTITEMKTACLLTNAAANDQSF